MFKTAGQVSTLGSKKPATHESIVYCADSQANMSQFSKSKGDRVVTSHTVLRRVLYHCNERKGVLQTLY